MRNIKLVIEYDGTGYCGWQVQNVRGQKTGNRRQKTIQETIENVLEKILQEKVKLIGSGRTDSGVHAIGQTANFKTKSKMKGFEFKAALNSNLPLDIRIKSAEEVGLDFHSRFNAKSKLYRYRILNKDVDSVFLRHYSHFVPNPLDWKAMREESLALVGKHNFSSFQAKSFKAKDKKYREPSREIKKIEIFKNNGEILIDIEANGFLYNMARNIAGTLIEVGRGRLKEGAVKDILKKKNRCLAGPTAPAKGLHLIKVKY